jgi:hypothetical protein
MIVFLIAIDLIAIIFLGAVYRLVSGEAQRGRDIVLEMTNYKHMAEDMLPTLRLLLLFAFVFFACLCSMQVGNAWINSPYG